MQAQLIEFEQDEALSRHQRKCLICRHPDREDIEDDFLHWGNVWKLAQYYKIDDYRSIYRHARATGLLERRRTNFRSALDQIIENAADAKVTGDTVIRAIRAYSCLDKEGRWAEPPTQVVFTVVRTSSSGAAASTTTSSSRIVAPKVGDQPAPSPPPPPPPPTPVPVAPIAPTETTSDVPASGAPIDKPHLAHLPPPPPRVEERPHALVAAAAASTPTQSGSQPRTLIYGTGIRNHANSLKT
jgi:hypothetical protein